MTIPASMLARLDTAIRAAGVAIDGVDVNGLVTPSNLQTAAQPTIDAFDASAGAQTTWQTTQYRTLANTLFNADATPQAKALKAFVLILLDEVNTLRAAIPRRVVSITRSTTTATVTTDSAHGLAVGNPIAIAGADVAGYNLATTVATVPSATTFTYTMANSGVTPATGSIFWTRGAVPSMADRTVAQLRTAIQTKLDAGTAD